ncbi:DUF2937 family protein [Devosia sp. PTR5]|uniref:DUF2937 family protein n=1 Tax=Devosia oryzisoli TaxID=2774138 RepID=A0A927FTV5_9HYPH|nr:DUF2937 family protein [Devosia oryzisoli]MBD8066200.1 DUF2937 family protein [Devosia oryzisoli]
MWRRMVAGIGGIGLAAVLSQFPEYAQQYTQRLGGAVDELRVITTDFDRAAEAGGLDRTQALGRYNASNDEFLAGRGTSMTATFQRFERLSQTLAEIEGADPATRLANLPAYLDSDIGRRTLEAYRPAVPMTVEGVLYAGGGFILGYLLISGLLRFFALPFGRRNRIRRSPGY